MFEVRHNLSSVLIRNLVSNIVDVINIDIALSSKELKDT